MLRPRQRVLFFVPLALILIPFLLWPALLGLITSFTNYVPFQKLTLRFVGFSNYARILNDSDFRAAIANVSVFVIASVAVELLLGIAIAYVLRKPFRGRPLVRFILLIPWLVSPVANGVMWHYLFNTENGLVNFLPAALGLPHPPSPLSSGLALIAAMSIEIWRKTPLVSFLVLPGIVAIPAVQWDQAELEGLSPIARMRHIVLPRLRVLLLTVGLLLTGDALGTSDSIVILTGGGPGSETMLPGLYSYRQAFQTFDWTGGSTSAWLIMAAVLIVGVVYVLLLRRKTRDDSLP